MLTKLSLHSVLIVVTYSRFLLRHHIVQFLYLFFCVSLYIHTHLTQKVKIWAITPSDACAPPFLLTHKTQSEKEKKKPNSYHTLFHSHFPLRHYPKLIASNLINSRNDYSFSFFHNKPLLSYGLLEDGCVSNQYSEASITRSYQLQVHNSELLGCRSLLHKACDCYQPHRLSIP